MTNGKTFGYFKKTYPWMSKNLITSLHAPNSDMKYIVVQPDTGMSNHAICFKYVPPDQNVFTEEYSKLMMKIADLTLPVRNRFVGDTDEDDLNTAFIKTVLAEWARDALRELWTAPGEGRGLVPTITTMTDPSFVFKALDTYSMQSKSRNHQRQHQMPELLVIHKYNRTRFLYMFYG